MGLWGVVEWSDVRVGGPWAKDVCRKKPFPQGSRRKSRVECQRLAEEEVPLGWCLCGVLRDTSSENIRALPSASVGKRTGPAETDVVTGTNPPDCRGCRTAGSVGVLTRTRSPPRVPRSPLVTERSVTCGSNGPLIRDAESPLPRSRNPRADRRDPPRSPMRVLDPVPSPLGRTPLQFPSGSLCGALGILRFS